MSEASSLDHPAGAAGRRLWSQPLLAVSLAFILVVLLAATIGAPLARPYTTAINIAARNIAPFSLEHGWLYVLGSDNLGRSILARVIAASQLTVFISVAAVSISLGLGLVLGILAASYGGWQSSLIMRVNDAVMSFPVLLLAILLLYILPTERYTLIVVLAFSRLPLFLRVARAETLEVRERLFILASQSIGSRSGWIMRRHVLPHVLPTMLTLAAMEIAFVMISESSLSFIGLGVQSPQISWGVLVSQGSQYLSTMWWLAVIPGTMIVLTGLALNVIVARLRLYIDPKQRWRVDA